MKKLISGILCTALAATCLCGCGKEPTENKKSADNQGTFYLLKEVVEKNDAGEVMRRETYEYNDVGLVTSMRIDQPEQLTVWNEEEYLYEYEWLPCDGEIDFENHITYDQHGNITCTAGDNLGDGSWKYQYSYDETGKVTKIRSYFGEDAEPKHTMDMEYHEDGTVELWNRALTDRDEPLRCWETTGDRIDKMQWRDVEGLSQYFFEYDKDGNLAQFYATFNDGDPFGQATRTYDQEGRVTSETGFRSGEENTTYQYQGDKLVAINDEQLEYSGNVAGQMIVKYKEYELTYEAIELTEEEIALAHRRWNQFCGGLAYYHGYGKGMDGMSYPVYDANTVLLLPKVVYY